MDLFLGLLHGLESVELGAVFVTHLITDSLVAKLQKGGNFKKKQKN